MNEPSVVAISARDGRVKAVGLEARNMLGREPRETIEVVRPMRDGVIADYVVTQEMLRYFIIRSVGRFSLTKPDVMLCVPAGVTGGRAASGARRGACGGSAASLPHQRTAGGRDWRASAGCRPERQHGHRQRWRDDRGLP